MKRPQDSQKVQWKEWRISTFFDYDLFVQKLLWEKINLIKKIWILYGEKHRFIENNFRFVQYKLIEFVMLSSRSSRLTNYQLIDRLRLLFIGYYFLCCCYVILVIDLWDWDKSHFPRISSKAMSLFSLRRKEWGDLP